MKIGILTLLEQLNYGGILQAYALSTFLRGNGYEADVLRIQISPKNDNLLGRFLTPNGGIRLDKLRSLLSLRRKGAWVNSEIFRRLRTIRFIERNVHTNGISFSESELADVLKNYDAAMVGSDQVWNPYYYGQQNPFLLKDIKDIPKIAYAASFGISTLPDEYVDNYSKAVSQFDAVSCREKSGCDIVEQLTGKQPEWVVDPVLLLGKEEWACLADDVSDDGYIFVYWCGELDALKDNLLKVRQSNVLPIHLFLSEYHYRIDMFQHGNPHIESMMNDVKNIRTYFHAGPLQFVRQIAHASEVMTDSFHGMVLSVLFDKPFWVYLAYSNERAAIQKRITDFVKKLGLSERVSHEVKSEILSEELQLNRAVLEEWKKQSAAYLKKCMDFTVCKANTHRNQ